jgi:hypothetical protein
MLVIGINIFCLENISSGQLILNLCWVFVKDVTLKFFLVKTNSLSTQYLYVYKPLVFFQFYDIENLMKIFQKLAKAR